MTGIGNNFASFGSIPDAIKLVNKIVPSDQKINKLIKYFVLDLKCSVSLLKVQE